MPKLKIRFLKALNGDCIFVSYTEDDGIKKNILIDGGPSETYVIEKNSKGKKQDGDLKHLIEELRNSGQKINLLILTHIDDDHIDGILNWFSDDEDAEKIIEEIWFNGGQQMADFLKSPENNDLNLEIFPSKDLKTSVPQAILFTNYILEKKIWNETLCIQGNSIERFNLKIHFLSPDTEKLKLLLKLWKKKKPGSFTTSRMNDYSKTLLDHIKSDNFDEDDSPTNGSSIGFILRANGKNFLFLGDSHPSVLIAGLKQLDYSKENPLVAEMVKLSHHGSAGNTSRELLAYIDSPSYVVSTNGRIHQHPDKLMLARLIDEKKDITIYSNYPDRLNMVFTVNDRSDFPHFKIAGIDEPIEFNL